jgi:transposase-like protein
MAKHHDICRNLIKVWVQKYEAGDFDEDAAAADMLQQYEARMLRLSGLSASKDQRQRRDVRDSAKSRR